MSSVSTSGSGAPKSSFSFGRIWDQYGMLVVFAVLFIACAIFVPNFATFINMKGLGLAISMSGMVACGMLFCLASGDFDLSVASVIACAGVTTAVVINLTESLWIGVAAGLLLGVLCGLVNGFVIAKLKINALITTLATMQIVRGLAYIISDGKAVGIEDESFFALGYANWFGLPAPIWLTVACLIIFGLLLNKTTFGRNTLAIGGNEEAARLAGVPVVGKNVRTLIDFYMDRSSSGMVYPGYSNYQAGMDVQGEKVQGEKLNITLHASNPYSSEGIPMKDLTLLKEGELKAIHGNARFAYYLGVEPTGIYSAVKLDNGTKTLEEMKKEPYLYVVSFSDFSMDSLSGYFGGEIRLAYLFDGEKVTPVTGGSVSGNLLELQKDMAFSTERYKDKDYDGPFAVEFHGVAVAGK